MPILFIVVVNGCLIRHWKADRLFFIPGLYSVTELPDLETGEVIKRWSYTLITRNANAVKRHIHNGGDNKGRMPLLLPFSMALDFLNEELSAEQY